MSQKVVSDLLLDIASELNGYTIGKPWRFTEHSLAAVVPICRATDEERNYRLMSESKDMIKIRDTGNISQLELTNKDEYPVLIKAGEIITGATQERTLLQSTVIMAGDKETVECACVHSTKGIRAGQTMKSGGYSPVQVRRAVYSNRSYDYGKQNEIWSQVRASATSARSSIARAATYYASGPMTQANRVDGNISINAFYSTPIEDLAGHMAETETKLKDILKKVPVSDNQVGICLITINGIESLESFNHKDSWTVMKKYLVGAEAATILDASQDNPFEFKEEKARKYVQELLNRKFEVAVSVEKPRTRTYRLADEKFTGEVVTLDNRAIHCAFVSKA